MELQEIMQLVANNGLGIVLVAYFIFKDYHQSGKMLELIGDVKALLAALQAKLP